MTEFFFIDMILFMHFNNIIKIVVSTTYLCSLAASKCSKNFLFCNLEKNKLKGWMQQEFGSMRNSNSLSSTHLVHKDTMERSAQLIFGILQ